MQIKAYKNAQWNRFFTAKADLIYVQESQNRIGVDPYPTFHYRLKELISYQKISFNPSSVNNGYTKSPIGAFYVKNIDFVDLQQVNAQFQVAKDSPPYGFSSESEYELFLRTTMDTHYSSDLEAKFARTPLEERVHVSYEEDKSIGVSYIKVEETVHFADTFTEGKICPIGEPKDYEILG